MKTDLKNYIQLYKNFLADDYCNKIVEEIKFLKFQEHTFYDPKTNKHLPKSGSQELAMSFDNTHSKNDLTKKLWHAIDRYIKFYNFPWFDSWQGYTAIRFNEYKESKKMALHCDHIQSMFDGDRKGIPILSCLGVLNDDYEGGEFIMFDDYEIKLKQGDLIIFPSNFLYPHKVEPVTKGTRYSYISWVW